MAGRMQMVEGCIEGVGGDGEKDPTTCDYFIIAPTLLCLLPTNGRSWVFSETIVWGGEQVAVRLMDHQIHRGALFLTNYRLVFVSREAQLDGGSIPMIEVRKALPLPSASTACPWPFIAFP